MKSLSIAERNSIAIEQMQTRAYKYAPDMLKILQDEIQTCKFPALEIDPIEEKDLDVFVINVFEADTTNPLFEINVDDGVFVIETAKGAFSHLEWSGDIIEILHKLSESKPLRQLVKNLKRSYS